MTTEQHQVEGGAPINYHDRGDHCIDLCVEEVKDGYIVSETPYTIGQVARSLTHLLDLAGNAPDEYGMKPNDGPAYPWPLRYAWIACHAVTGGSEGHYIHVAAILAKRGWTNGGANYEYQLLLLGKTFEGMERAQAIADACARFLGA